MYNKEQKRAINSTLGPKMIIAGAGTGKTTVITQRIISIIDEGIKPEKIYAMTFTNKASDEMKERIIKEKGTEGSKVKISTFHSFALKMLRLLPEGLPSGFDETFSVIDEKEKAKIIKKEKKKLDIEKTKGVRKEIGVISKYKNALVLGTEKELSRKNQKIYEVYKEYMVENNLLDFDDILIYFFLALDEKSFQKKILKKIEYLLVDEFQDTNILQYETIKKIVDITNNIFIVGDPDQSIYKFRGAEYANTMNFEREFSPEIIPLTTNYRSTQEILDFSNNVINNNERTQNKYLKGLKNSFGSVEKNDFKDYKAEIDYIVRRISQIDLSKKSVAIIYRNNKQSSFFEQEFSKRQIPYVVFGDMNFFDRMEIKYMVNLCHAIINPNNDHFIGEIINIPPRKVSERKYETMKIRKEKNESVFEAIKYNDFGFPKGTKEGIKDFFFNFTAILDKAKETGKMTDFFNEALKLTGYKEMIEEKEEEYRLENIEVFVNSFFPEESNKTNIYETIKGAMDELVLTSPSEKESLEDKVVLTTFHRSKGLEFDCVFLPFLQDGVVPSLKDQNDFEIEAIEEERRVFYVGITRAREKLHLSYSRYYRQFGPPMYQPSRFLAEGDKEK